jgi:tRNA(Ile)-lysidine synthase
VSRRPRSLASRDGRTVWLDAAACDGRLTLRRRRPGDRFQPLGLARAKKLQDFLVDAHVPREDRDGIPLLATTRGIAWVAGQRPAEWAKVTPATRRLLRLRASLDTGKAPS